MNFPSGFSVPGPQTNVPEFNDCQRFIVNGASTGAREYAPLMAIFASQFLDTLTIPIDTAAAHGAQIFAAAEVLNYSLDFVYPQLGIGPYFNCLYIYGSTGKLKARMVHVGADEAKCSNVYLAADVPGQQLAVREVHVAKLDKDADYPPVARWDWAKEGVLQYIGVRCGRAWCEVGPGTAADSSAPAFVSSEPHASTLPPGVSMAEYRVRAIKGWYDQQLLAMESGSAASPSTLRGTVFPDTGLAALTKESLEGHWQVVSHIALDAPPAGQLTSELAFYKQKFNLDPVPTNAPFSAMNHVRLCFGTIGSCTIPPSPTPSLKKSCGKLAWTAAAGTKRLWSSITSATGDTSLYRCATPMEHPSSIDIPKTARWRWLAKDETSWRWCPSGCCEVNGDQFALW